MNKIEISNLSKSYPTFALEKINFSVPKSYVTGLIGKNGMGKTTTIKSILSLIHYEGNISIDGKSIKKDSFNQKIGVVMDDSFLAKDWTMTLVNKAMRIGYTKWNEKSFWDLLNRFQIDKKLKVKELSRGMKIKLMLAIALSHEAEILILDEPTSGLDPSMRDEFIEIISEFMENENHSVLFSTHITQDLEAIADYIVFIDQGKVVLAKEKEEFINYFMILKGENALIKALDENSILGKKISPYGAELLIKRQAVNEIPSGFKEDKLTLDRIMVLYGRKK